MEIMKICIFLLVGFGAVSAESEGPGAHGFSGFVLEGVIKIPDVMTIKTLELSPPKIEGLIGVASKSRDSPYTETLSFWAPNLHGLYQYQKSKLIEEFRVFGRIADFVTLNVNGNAYLVLTTSAHDNKPVSVSLETRSDASKDLLTPAKLYILALENRPGKASRFKIVASETAGKYGFCTCIFDSLKARPKSQTETQASASGGVFNTGNCAFLTYDTKGKYICGSSIGLDSESQAMAFETYQTISLGNPSLVNLVSNGDTFLFVAGTGNCCGNLDGIDVFAQGASGIYFKVQCLPASNVVSSSAITIDDKLYAAITTAASVGPGSIDIYEYSTDTNTFELIHKISADNVRQARFRNLGEVGSVLYILKSDVVETYSFQSEVCHLSSPTMAITGLLDSVSVPKDSTLLRPVSFIANGKTIYQLLITNAYMTNVYTANFGPKKGYPEPTGYY